MATKLLMPKATAVWLIDNTSLTFEQIADFCSLHLLEVQGIADGDVAGKVKGVNPINNGQLSRDEIKKAEADSSYRMKLLEPKTLVATKRRKGPRYTPISRRNERPGAIKWLIRNHPELPDAAIIRLIGTTKTTIEAVRNGTHWNSANLTMMDPVTLGLCTQVDLDMEVKKSTSGKGKNVPPLSGTILLSAEEALSKSAYRLEDIMNMRTGENLHKNTEQETNKEIGGVSKGALGQGKAGSKSGTDSEELDAESVFASLKSLKKDNNE